MTRLSKTKYGRQGGETASSAEKGMTNSPSSVKDRLCGSETCPLVKSGIPGVVLQAHGNVSYLVKLEGGRVRKCHIDQLRAAHAQTPSVEMFVGSSLPESTEMTPSDVEIPKRVQEPPQEPTTIVETPPQIEPEDVTLTEPTQVNTRKEYPKRVRSQVQWYDPSFS